MRRIVEYFSTAPDRPLYHYTGIATLLGIEEHRELWASHAYYMNDAKELSHACEVMKHVDFFRFAAAGSQEQEFLNQLRAWMDACLPQPSDLFVFSLSEEQSLLSQWRSYTPHGKGVSIGFSTALVAEIAATNRLRLGRCLYNLPEQCELIESLLEKLWESYGQQGNAQDPRPNFFPFFEHYRPEIVQVMALVKHEAFAEEREWRLISGVDVKPDQICFRQGSGASTLTPYIKLALSDADSLFDLVTLGPTPHETLAMHSLSSFLRTSKLSAAWASCKIPYREW